MPANQLRNASLAGLSTVLRSSLTSGEKERFWRNGFVILPSLLSAECVEVLRARFVDLFAGKFSTGVYPDEWYWREGVSLPLATREICNGWKADEFVASVVLSSSLGNLVSDLMGWSCGARLAQDDVLWKPAGGGAAIGFHQDGQYISEQFAPLADNSVTLWMALDDTDSENGAVQYVPGSHRWPVKSKGTSSDLAQLGFHASGGQNYLSAVQAAAEVAGEKVELVQAVVPRGGCVLHHQDTWHGSGQNKSAKRLRRALVGHYLRANSQFRSSPPPTYIYGRYKLGSSLELHDSFFPRLTSQPGSSSN